MKFLSKAEEGERKKLKTVVMDYIKESLQCRARESKDEHTFSWGFSFESPWRQNCNKLISTYTQLRRLEH